MRIKVGGRCASAPSGDAHHSTVRLRLSTLTDRLASIFTNFRRFSGSYVEP